MKNNLTLRELDEKVNINYSQLARIERGESMLTQQHIEVLTSFFNVSADFLLGLPQKSIPLNDGTFKAIKILGSVRAGNPDNINDNFIGYLQAKVDDPESHFYLEINGDSMSPTFEDGDYVLVKCQNHAANNDIVVAGLNGDEATVKRYKEIGSEAFLFADNTKYQALKLEEELDPHILGVVTGFYRPKIK